MSSRKRRRAYYEYPVVIIDTRDESRQTRQRLLDDMPHYLDVIPVELRHEIRDWLDVVDPSARGLVMLTRTCRIMPGEEKRRNVTTQHGVIILPPMLRPWSAKIIGGLATGAPISLVHAFLRELDQYGLWYAPSKPRCCLDLRDKEDVEIMQHFIARNGTADDYHDVGRYGIALYWEHTATNYSMMTALDSDMVYTILAGPGWGYHDDGQQMTNTVIHHQGRLACHRDTTLLWRQERYPYYNKRHARRSCHLSSITYPGFLEPLVDAPGDAVDYNADVYSVNEGEEEDADYY